MKYVALLRGINVGGRHRVEMGQLAEHFESLGYEGVGTYINTGNVIFESTLPAATILRELEALFLEKYDFSVPVVLRCARDIATLCAEIPQTWHNDKEQKTDILFLWAEYDDKKTLALMPRVQGVDTVRYISGAVVWHVKKGVYSKSGLHKLVGTKIYKKMTVRNVNTVRKLGELLR